MIDDHVIHVVEDDLAVRDALMLLLKSAGLPTRGYESAEDFLEKEGHSQRSSLLVDMRLPGMNGLMLQKQLFSCGADPTIVMITGHGDIALAVANCFLPLVGSVNLIGGTDIIGWLRAWQSRRGSQRDKAIDRHSA
jgi:FixJ family two-component response regulator